MKEPASDTQFIEAYLEFTRTKSDSLFWAYTQLQDLLRTDPGRGWSLTLRIIDAAPDDNTAHIIAAGPLEDLLYGMGPQFIDEVERLVEINLRFRSVLTTVAGPFSTQKDTANRLARLGCQLPYEEAEGEAGEA